ncbi:hypothetical protein VTG60DRAFT_6148 [Thermothelomyces hinnuleus]
MEPSSWIEIASSKVYSFSVGPSHREFTIHSALVEAQSPVLDTLVNDTNFKEARDGHAELNEVDEETFAAFVEYAYTGRYSAADVRELSFFTDFNPVKDDYVYEYSHARVKSYPKPAIPWLNLTRIQRSKLWQKFKAAVAEAWPDTYWTCTTPGGTSAPIRIDAEVLLRHACVYIFADSYRISRLMRLSFYVLGKALMAPGFTEEDLVILLRYCYDEFAPEKLRQLLLWYAACRVGRLWKTRSFQGVLEAHADVAVAILGLIVENSN